MNPPFFITGLPRSRTAWLAAWLTTDSAICYHDPQGVTLEELQAANPGRRVGISGPETCLLWEQYPEAPWVIVRRESQAALRAFMEVAFDRLKVSDEALAQFWDGRLQLLNRMQGKHTLVVEFDELNREEWGKAIWEHIHPQSPFDSERWRLFNGLNIQQELRKDRTWH